MFVLTALFARWLFGNFRKKPLKTHKAFCSEGDNMETESSGARKLKIIMSGTLILFGLYLTTLYNYLLFHSIAEVFIIVIACGIFVVAWNSRRFLDNNYLLFIGLAYLFIAVLELIHTLAYTGMGIFKGYGADLPTQLWVAARYMESFTVTIQRKD